MMEYETRERDYCRALDGLRFSQEDKDQMLETLRMAQRPARGRRPARRALAIALAAVLVVTLTVGAGAAGVFNAFTAMFPQADEDTGLIARIGRPLEVRAEDGGVTVTADAVVRDSYNVMAVLSVTMEGIERKPVDFNRVDLEIGGDVLSAGYSVSDQVPGDDTIQIAASWIRDDLEPIPQGTGTILFRGLTLYDHSIFQREIAGNWDLEIPLEELEDMDLSLPAGQKIDVEGVEVTLSEIEISPLSIRVLHTADLNGQDPAREITLPDGFTQPLKERAACLNTVVTLKDGTEFIPWEFDPSDVPDAGYHQGSVGYNEEDDGTLACHILRNFDRPVDPESIASVTIEGVEVYRAE